MSVVEEALKRHQAVASREAEPAVQLPSKSLQPAGAAAGQRHFGDPRHTVAIDMEALRRERLLPPADQERQIVQQLRAVKRPLLKVMLDGRASSNRVIMVTSALEGEGKTFTSINLAFSLAREKDHSVLLIDGDTAKPRLSSVLNQTDRAGLLDVLQDPSRDIRSVIVPTSVQGLSLLPIGKRAENVSELLGSARMHQIVADLLSLDPNLLIVVDSPPVLLTSDARVMAGLFSQILMIVRAGATPQHAVTDCLAALGESASVRLVLNDAVHASSGDYYGYGYGDRMA
jgi:exopolysaccharide/PEP-CTERM locus tyrosine autokinase